MRGGDDVVACVNDAMKIHSSQKWRLMQFQLAWKLVY